MKKWISLLIISIAILLAGFMPTHLLPAWSVVNDGAYVTPSSPQSISQFLFFGSQVKGQVDISGANSDIYFYILDSTGRRVFDAGRVYNSYAFYWQAPKNDYFRFVFDNSMSWVSIKNVSWTFSFYYYTVTLWIAGLILLALSITMLIKNEILPKQARKEESRIAHIPVPPEMQ